MTDEQLAMRTAGGDDEAFERLARKMRPLIWTIAGRYYAPGLDRDDLRQAALVGLWKGCRTYRTELLPTGGNFNAFIAMCIDRHVQTAVKTALRLKHRVLGDALRLDAPASLHGETDIQSLHESVPSDRQSAFDELEERERIRSLVDAIKGTLTPLERESLVGTIFRGESYLEIEQRFFDIERAPGEKAKKVDNAIERARRKLRVVLAEDPERLPFGVAA